MSVLTGHEIQLRMQTGEIVIDPLPQHHQFGQNSVDLHLGPVLYEYRRGWLDWLLGAPLNPRRGLPPLVEVPLRRGRWVLRPGRLYLGATLEWTETRGLVPYIDGRSSLARLGVFAHVAAGRGDNGFKGRWTVELVCASRQGVVVCPGDRLFQVTYHTLQGVQSLYGSADHNGRYQGSTGPVASRLATLGRW